MRFLVGSPRSYTIRSVLNPLTGPNGVVDMTKAAAQHARLVARLGGDSDVATVDAGPDFPDGVFVANAGLFICGIFIPARFHVRERRGEEEAVISWAAAAGYKVVRLPEEEGLYFEGDGDCARSHGSRLWIGYGAGRTTLRGVEAVRRIVAPLGITVTPLHISDRRTYHLDLCLCPLPNGRALAHLGSFLPAGRTALRQAFGSALIDVPMKWLYGCNAVPVGRTLVVTRIDPEWRAWISERAGMRVVDVNVGEFQKAGGGVACLVLPLEDFSDTR